MTPKTTLFKDTFFYSAANWVSRIIKLAIAPLTIAYFSPAEYGYFQLVLTIAAFLSVVGLLSVASDGLPRFFIDAKDEQEKQAYLSSSFFISAIGMAVMVVLIFVSAPIVPKIFKEVDKVWAFVAVVALSTVAEGIRYVGMSLLKWTFRSQYYLQITILQAGIGGIITVIGLIFWEWRSQAILTFTGCIVIATGVLAISTVGNYIRLSQISKSKMRELIAYSLPLLGLNVFAFSTRFVDRVFLAGFTSMNEVGVFSVAGTIASVFDTAVSGFFLPGLLISWLHFENLGRLRVMPIFLAGSQRLAWYR